MNSIAFNIKPSPSSNDHEVRILIDGEDWLGSSYLGMDPPDFFSQEALLKGGELLVGRCDCGCVGCDDVAVQVVRQESSIVWTSRKGWRLCFSAPGYDRAVNVGMVDFSWENESRTAERLVADLFKGAVLDDGSRFDWASARIGVGIITLSFSLDGQQKTFELGWDGRDPNSALPAAKRFCADRVRKDTLL